MRGARANIAPAWFYSVGFRIDAASPPNWPIVIGSGEELTA
jgi:hypothetical protein